MPDERLTCPVCGEEVTPTATGRCPKCGDVVIVEEDGRAEGGYLTVPPGLNYLSFMGPCTLYGHLTRIVEEDDE